MLRLLTFLFVMLVFFSISVQAQETAYQRVKDTGIIRCGYIIWPPFIDVDINTKTFSGMNYDYMEAVADSLNLKVEWALEINPGDQVTALETGKIDAVCAAEGPLVPSTSRFLHYSEPMGYFPFFLYVRPDDTRFDKSLSSVNHEEVRVAVVDGDISGEIVRTQFPKAVRHAMPQLGAPGQMMLEVAGGKADIVINDPLSMSEYFKSNPNGLRQVPTKGPIAVIPNTFSVLREPGGLELVSMLNQAMKNLENYGKAKIILEKYLKDSPNLIYPTALPYRVSE